MQLNGAAAAAAAALAPVAAAGAAAAALSVYDPQLPLVAGRLQLNGMSSRLHSRRVPKPWGHNTVSIIISDQRACFQWVWRCDFSSLRT